MEFKSKDVDRALSRKGFVRDEKKDHIYFYHYYRGFETGPSTHISHGTSSISGTLIGLMKRQLQLDSSNQFADLINCPMDAADYIKLMDTKKIFSTKEIDDKLDKKKKQ